MVEPTETETKETLDALRRGDRGDPRRGGRGSGDRAAARRTRRRCAGWTRSAAAKRPVDPRGPVGSTAAVRIFSGIQPTGRKHLGNYIGAIAQYVAGQERGEGIFCIVDLHATTVAYDPRGAARAALRHGGDPARGGPRPGALHPLPPERRPEHTELTWLLCSVTELGRLQRMHQFRDKSLAAARARLGRACCSIRCCRRPTCSPTARRRCRWARTSASTSS